MEAMYAWVGQIMQGYTPAQVRRIAAQARTAALTAPIGATQRVGSSTETAWIRYYPEMDDLIRTLKKAGIEPKRPVAVRCRSTTCWVSAGRR
ncbi:MAG TPA: hypothetical protein PKE46_05070 [Micropruina sp.]|nr:hypothetical protein [Micropruina sp.]HMR21489.1 hypothetical protein [Micropruina sp.]